MAHEAVLVMELEQPIPFIVADGTAITKGTVCKMATPMTASASNGAVDKVAGILFGDKIVSNGQTTAGIYRRGIFRMKISGAAAIGDPVVTDTHANHVKSAIALTTFAISGTRVLGHMLEDATDGQEKLVYVNVTTINGVN